MTENVIGSVLQEMLDEEAARSEAIRQLAEIAEKYPDLIEKIAERLKRPMSTEPSLHLTQISQKRASKSPTDAIKQWLIEHGQGTATEMIRDIADDIVTSGKSQKTIIHSTISSLKRRNKLVVRRGKNGQYIYSLREVEDSEDED